MVQEIVHEAYKCDVCKEEYSSLKEAKSCERKLVTQDKGVKIGDLVRITQGGGTGERAKVTRIMIMDKYWGHYVWKRYWHTIALLADCEESYGFRLLVWDSYETMRQARKR